MKNNKGLRGFIRLIIEIVLVLAILFLILKFAGGWVGDSAAPHPLQGDQLIQHSLFNRIIK